MSKHHLRMKHLHRITLGISLISLLGLSSVFATAQDNQILDQIESDQLTADDLRFNTFQSCDEMETVLTDYIKDNFERNNFRWGPQPMLVELFAEESADFAADTTTTAMMASVPTPQIAKLESWGWGDDLAWINLSSTSSFSTTNTQVICIDEADIIKSDGDYLYYYNQKEQKVQIIKTPLNILDRTIDLARLDVVTEINLPNTFNGIQLYRQGDNLVIISNRWRNNYDWGFLNNGNQVDVIVYDVSNPAKPALIRFTELDGSYHDSRVIWDKLYLINQLYLDRYRPMRQWKTVDDINLDEITISPKNIDIAYTKNSDKKNLIVGDQTFPYHISVNEADCNNIYYVLPSEESVEQFGLNPSFTTINVIDLSSTENTPDITTAFGNTNTIHMAKDNVYLTSNFYVPGESRSCPPNARCMMPTFFGGQQHTLIHKFNVANTGVVYQDSTLANGSPLTQYSMDQWPEGNFRILTSTRNPDRATHLYILDKDLKTIWSVENIEPGEEFKSSRYIGDKLYLVTFEATDPLFVIDMVQPTDPKIIGELVIPGFSTYLHPYGPVQNNVQYLLWLGRDTDLNERGWTIQEGIKLDLYKVDYNQKRFVQQWKPDGDGRSWAEISSDNEGILNYCQKFYPSTDAISSLGDVSIDWWCERGKRNCVHTSRKPAYSCLADGNEIWKVAFWQGKVNMHYSEGSHVAVTQEFSEVRGDRGSQSEAVHNPRMFVWDAENKLLVLPMQLTDQEEGNEICESERDPEGNIIRQECRTNDQQTTSFIGMKAIHVSPSTGITETASFDYTHLYKQDPEIYRNGWYNTRLLMPRVGYVGDVLYQVNGAFGHFIDTANGSQQAFLPLGETNINFDPTNGWGNSGMVYNNDMKGTAVCLADKWWTLYTSSTDDCRYCASQLALFENTNNTQQLNYLEEVINIVDCDWSQLECSDAWITWYPTWVSLEGETSPWFKQLDDLYEIANCW